MKNDMEADLPFHMLPGGTVTFLFTDIEGSTELLQRLGDEYAELLAAHRRILRAAFEAQGGREVDTQGDAFFYSFRRASEALNAAVDAQRALAAHSWPGGAQVRVRMGLHTGEPLVAREGYVGMDVHRAARIAHAGHGGQVLLSGTTASLVAQALPEAVRLLDLGRHQLKDLRAPERISQLIVEGLPAEFPPLKSLGVLPSEILPHLAVARPPTFLAADAKPPERGPFVGREHELAWLGERLERANRGEGGIAFVTGGPGRGKTVLLDEFSRRAMAANSELLAVRGESSAHTGVGDPYQPFQDAVGMLVGDLEAAWTSGYLEREGAMRLWQAMPFVTQVLLEVAPDLIDVFALRRTLLSRLRGAVEGGSSWLERLANPVDGGRPPAEQRARAGLFEGFEALLWEISATYPLLFVLDDLQWADQASIDLLFHLGRRLAKRRILVLCAYRSEEVALGQAGGPHPLEKLVPEFKRLFGQIGLDLGAEREGEGRRFVSELIDVEANKLSAEFRDAVYDRTGGHPLFTVELLRAMRARRILVKDEAGQWAVTRELDWDTLPARVEGVVEERLARLEPGQRDLLAVASVEGMRFTAQVVAAVRAVSTDEVVTGLSKGLSQVHRLVEEQGVVELANARLYQYRFRHHLFQVHLYESLGPFQRELLHGKVGRVKEALYGEQADEIAPALARHFSLAGDREKAIRYLLSAGDQARMVYANSEANASYQQALVYQDEMGDAEGVIQTLLKLGLVYTASFDAQRAGESYGRAFDLLDALPRKLETPNIHLPARQLRIAVAEPIQWDPGLIGDDVSSFVLSQLFEGLTEVTPDHNVVPAAALRWDVGEGGSQYTFHLRRGLRWSDGSPLRAEDFEFALKRNLSRARTSPVGNLLTVIAGAMSDIETESADLPGMEARALDEHTFRMRLERPIAYLPQLMAHHVAFPAPRAGMGDAMGDALDPHDLLCNGPYRVEEWSPGRQLILSRNLHYRTHIAGNVERVICTFIHDLESALRSYAAGELDAVSMITADAKAVTAAWRRFPDELMFAPQPSTFYLTFLVNQPPFDDAGVRRAFIQSVDREALIRQTSQGQYRPGLGGFVPPGMPGHSPGIGRSYNPDSGPRAKSAAGYPGGVGFPAVTLLTSGGGADDPIVRFLLRAWHEGIGVEVNHETVSWAEWLRRRDDDPPPLSLSGWSADYPDPDGMLRALFHSSEGLNPPRWKDQRFDALVERAASTLDQAERIRLYQEADRILVAEQAVVMPLGYAQGRHLKKPWVRMPNAPPGMVRFKDVLVMREL
jgi:ABC-type oligopeptide transport system substrate-binding subunit/class 3 adenylate cyclase